MVKKLKSFQVAVGNQGQELRIEVQFEDGTKEQIDFGAALAPRLVQSFKARRRQKRCDPNPEAPSQSTCHGARDVRTGAIVGADLIAIGFATEEGPPVEIAMPRSLAEKTIRTLLDDLKKSAQAKH